MFDDEDDVSLDVALVCLECGAISPAPLEAEHYQGELFAYCTAPGCPRAGGEAFPFPHDSIRRGERSGYAAEVHFNGRTWRF